MWLLILLKVTKNQAFTLSLEDKFFEKPQGGVQIDLLPAVLGLKTKFEIFILLLAEWIYRKNIFGDTSVLAPTLLE